MSLGRSPLLQPEEAGARTAASVRAPRAHAASRLLGPALCTVIGLGLALRSLWLGIALSRPMPASDQWEFVRDLMRFVEGHYGVLDLFAPHNEHRIFTARLSFFADYFFFHLGNLSVELTSYLTFALLAGVLAGVATAGRGIRSRVVAFALVLAALWSVAGWLNLGWAFQVAWSYVHLFPTLAIALFAAAARRTGRESWILLALSCACDALGAYSLTSGLCTVAPVTAVAIWLRCRPSRLGAFLLFHAVLVYAFMGDYSIPPNSMMLNPVRIVQYVAPYLGTAFPGSKRLAITAGAAGLLLSLPAIGAATWWYGVRGRRPETCVVVLLGVVVFVLAEGIATAVGRAGLENPTGLALRYGTPSLVFWAALALAAWRWFDGAARRLGRPAALVCLALAGVVASNTLGNSAQVWAYNMEGLDSATFDVINGVEEPDAIAPLYPWPEQLPPLLAFLRARQLGPFAEGESRYRAPINSLPDKPAASLDSCLGGIDRLDTNPMREARAQGWAVAPGTLLSAEWIVAIDPAGRLLGYTRPGHNRPDVRLPATRAEVVGFDFWFREGTPSSGDVRAFDLVAVFPGGGAAPCRVPAGHDAR